MLTTRLALPGTASRAPTAKCLLPWWSETFHNGTVRCGGGERTQLCLVTASLPEYTRGSVRSSFNGEGKITFQVCFLKCFETSAARMGKLGPSIVFLFFVSLAFFDPVLKLK